MQLQHPTLSLAYFSSYILLSHWSVGALTGQSACLLANKLVAD